VGETRVDLQHLLEDLRDAYTGALEETILTEIIANALDSGATRIALDADPVAATLTVVDDGRGMQRRELARYHDIAASTKARGDGIGFAGVGIKLGLLVAEEVTTETRRGATHVATVWHLATKYKAPWKWTTPPGMTGGRGTAVRLRVANPLSPLLDAGYIEEAVRRHFEPLLDPAFDDLLRRHYSSGVSFDVQGRRLPPVSRRARDRAAIPIRMGRKRLPSAIAILERHDAPLPDERQGIAVSTFGKVIKRGWDWLGLTPAAADRIGGLVEAPDLAASLTLSKNDFIRTGPRGATYLAYRKAIQEVVSRQLSAWGDGREGDSRPRTARLERDLERVLEDLADDFPLLRSLVDRRPGGQARLPMPGRGRERAPGPLFANVPVEEDAAASAGSNGLRQGLGDTPEGDVIPGEPQVEPPRPPEGEITPPVSETEPSPPGEPGEPAAPSGGDGRQEPAIVGSVSATAGRRRPARYGLLVQYESRPDDDELGRLVDSTIWVNDAHPAWLRASASRSTGYHLALAVALALAPLAVGAEGEHGFVTRFLAQWGSASERPRRRRRTTRG
jgi:hypothetical protein